MTNFGESMFNSEEEKQANIGDMLASSGKGDGNAPPPGDAAGQGAPGTGEQKKESPQDEAVKKTSPNTEDDKQSMEPTITLKDGTQMTQSQIEGMNERYRTLNYDHAKNKPIVDVVAALMQKGVDAKQISSRLLELGGVKVDPAEAEAKEKTGDKETKKKGPSREEQEKELVAWEEQEGIKLPAFMREKMLTDNSDIQKVLDSNQGLAQMMMQVLAHSQGFVDESKKAMESAKAQQLTQQEKQIQLNLNEAQQKHGLSNEDFDAFVAYFTSRGMTKWDFLNPQLTDTIVSDFKAVNGQPEMERIMTQHKKRLAAKGGLGSSHPGGGAGNTAKPGENAMQDNIDGMLKHNNKAV